MEILWALIGAAVLGVILSRILLGRGGGIRLTHPGAPDAADPAHYGFLRQEELDIRMPGPDEDLMDVLDLVQRTQEWRTAAQLLAGTGTGGERRWQRVQAFAGAAALELQQQPGGAGRSPGGQWLRVWRAEATKDAERAAAAAVHAEFLVQHAWRSAQPGRTTAQAGQAAKPGQEEAPDEFRIILEEAKETCAEAAALAPGDPVPYIVELSIARGLGYSREDFEHLWLQILDRAPHHMGAHLAALHYWCEKWHGSRELAMEFAEAAAARAPRGSLLAALPLFAVHEHLPDVQLVRSFHQSEVVTRAVEGALYAVHSARPDDPVLAHVRHMLIFFLVRGERWGEAMSQLVHADGHVGALPWTLSPDPAGDYALHRALAVAGYEANGGSPATLHP